jgi:hypothetical protein
MKVLSVLEQIRLCDPAPAAIIIHIDLSDGNLEAELNERFSDIAVLTSSARRGPGGGRHRCLLVCKTPFAVSFDDDSYPVDSDFFATVERLFLEHPRAALLEANVWHRNEPELPRATSLAPIPSYTGCGYAIRLDVYRQMRGHLDRPVPYAMEEPDLSLQLFVSGYQMMRAGELRVFHDTDLKHHRSNEITSGSIMNVALYASRRDNSGAVADTRGLLAESNVPQASSVEDTATVRAFLQNRARARRGKCLTASLDRSTLRMSARDQRSGRSAASSVPASIMPSHERFTDATRFGSWSLTSGSDQAICLVGSSRD